VTLDDGQQAVRIGYRPTPVARRFLADTTMITGLFGPLGTAKTTALCMKAWRYAQAFPGAKIAIVRDTWPNLRDTTMASFFTWFPPGVMGELHKTDKVFTVRTQGAPSQILFRALDDEKDIRNVLSLELAAAALDEPQGGPNTKGGVDPGINEDLYRSLLGRVGRQAGFPLKMLFMCGNPPAPSHWIAREFRYDGHGQPTNPHPKRRLYVVTREENRANLHPTYYEDLEEIWGSDTPLARRFLFGEWIEFATEQPFHREWIRFYGTDEEPAPEVGELVIEAGFDPAISKSDRAARSALVVAGQVRRGINRGRIYVLEIAAGHWSVLEQAKRILEAVSRRNIRTVRIEDVAYQRALGDVLDREARLAGVAVRIELVKPDADKLRRANAWSPQVEDGSLLFGPGQQALIDAMLAVPGDAGQWDLVDAAGICVRGFPKMAPESSRLPGTEPGSTARAAGYAVRPADAPPPDPAPRPPYPSPVRDAQPPSSGSRRAMGYSVRPRGSR
jgi:predicted phage terminase large subunit-like protein